jgi:hypothetical protein
MPRLLFTSMTTLILIIIPGIVSAHEHRPVGEYEMVVGWVDEPPFVGFKNAVELRLADAGGKPVLDLGDALKVEVIFGGQKTEALTLAPAFGATSGRPGEYRAPVIPTRPGTYAFHFVGTIRGQKVNEVFTASEQTFDPVRASSEIEFPAKDPTRADLALRVQRLAPRLDRVVELADQVKALAILGIVLGVAGVIAGLWAGRVRRSR